MRLLFVLLVALAACSSGPNTQFRAIGSYCTADSDCGTSPYRCAMAPTYRGGYCEKTCTSGMDCPSDSGCVTTLTGSVCRRFCDNQSTFCRTAEGYVCKLEQNVMVCDIP